MSSSQNVLRPERPVLLLDATGILVRCSKAAFRTRMLSSKGVETGPLFFFINTVARHIRYWDPRLVIACWDAPEKDGRKPWRAEAYPGYKDRIGHMSTAQADHWLLAMKFCDEAGIRNLCKAGYEADDHIAAAWRCLNQIRMFSGHHPDALLAGTPVIVSDDADFCQLLQDRACLAGIGKPGPEPHGTIRDAKWLKDEHGVTAEEWPLLRIVVGDRSDGIPGVPGYGPKKALKLLDECQWDIGVLCGYMEGRTPGLGRELHAWHTVCNLRTPPLEHQLEISPLWCDSFETSPRWMPADRHIQLLDFLRGLQMHSIMKRLESLSLFRGNSQLSVTSGDISASC